MTLCHTKKGNKIPEQEGTNPPPSEGLPPALTRARGRDVERPGPAVGRAIGGPSSKTCEAAKQNKRAETKTKDKKPRNTPAASRPKKRGLGRVFQENPKNARGPEWHPEENAKKRDARPKRAKRQTRRDKKTGTTNTSACGGVLLPPELCLLKRKNKQKKTTSAKT